MSQRNIDFGSFPDDPSADPIRSAFQKTQENFSELFQSQSTGGVKSLNKTPGAGITVNRSSGDVVASANIAAVRVYSPRLSVYLEGDTPGSAATLTQTSQRIVVDYGNTISGVTDISITGNISLTNVFATGEVSATGNVIGSYFIGDGSQLTGIAVATSLAGNLQGNLIGNTFSINDADIVSANYFIGDGSQLTGITAGGILAGNLQGNLIGNGFGIESLTFLEVLGNANVGDTITVGNGTGGNIEGAYYITANTFVATENITTVDLSATGNIDVTGNLAVTGTASLILSAPTETIGNIGNITSNTVQNVSWSSYNNYFAVLSSNATLDFTNIPNPSTSVVSSITLFLQQDSVGNRVVTWPNTVKWPNGSIPTQGNVANSVDIYTFLTYDAGTTIIGLQQVKGIV